MTKFVLSDAHLFQTYLDWTIRWQISNAPSRTVQTRSRSHL